MPFFPYFSACKITGSGQKTETIKLPLKGCGTLQVKLKVHKSLSVVDFVHFGRCTVGKMRSCVVTS